MSPELALLVSSLTLHVLPAAKSIFGKIFEDKIAETILDFASQTYIERITENINITIDTYENDYNETDSDRSFFKSKEFTDILVALFSKPMADLDLECVDLLDKRFDKPTIQEFSEFINILFENIHKDSKLKELYGKEFFADSIRIAFDTNKLVNKVLERLPTSNDSFQPILINENIIVKQSGFNLDYRVQPIQLFDREDEIASLKDFLSRDEKFCWWGIVGKSGIGKSKLLWSYCQHIKDKGVHSGFIYPDILNKFDWTTWQPITSTFIVIDDAILYYEKILKILDVLSIRQDLKHKVRIVLIDRDSSTDLKGKINSLHSSTTRYDDFLHLSDISLDAIYFLMKSVLDRKNIPVPKKDIILSNLKKIDFQCRPFYALLIAESIAHNVQSWHLSKDHLLSDYIINERKAWHEMSHILNLEDNVFESHITLLSICILQGRFNLNDLEDLEIQKISILPTPNTYNKQLYNKLVDFDDNELIELITPLKPEILGVFFLLEFYNEASKNHFKFKKINELIKLKYMRELFFSLYYMLMEFPTHAGTVKFLNLYYNSEEALYIVGAIGIQADVRKLITNSLQLFLDSKNFANAKTIYEIIKKLVGYCEMIGSLNRRMDDFCADLATLIVIAYCKTDDISDALPFLDHLYVMSKKISNGSFMTLDSNMTSEEMKLNGVVSAGIIPIYIAISIKHIIEFYIKIEKKNEVLKYYEMLKKTQDDAANYHPSILSTISEVSYNIRDLISINHSIDTSILCYLKILNYGHSFENIETERYELSKICHYLIRLMLLAKNSIDAEKFYTSCVEFVRVYLNNEKFSIYLAECAFDLQNYFFSERNIFKYSYYINELRKYLYNDNSILNRKFQAALRESGLKLKSIQIN